MSTLSALSTTRDIQNHLTRTPTEADRTFSSVRRLHRAVNLPITACWKASRLLSSATVAVIGTVASLSPQFLQRPLDAHCEKQAKRCLEKSYEVVSSIPAIRTWIESSESLLASPMLSSAASALSLVAQWTGHTEIAEHLDTASRVLDGDIKSTLAQKLIAPVIKSVYQRVANETANESLNLFYGLMFQYGMVSYVRSFAEPYVEAHTTLSTTLTTAEVGLMGYIHGPSIYKCAKAAKTLWDAKQQAVEVKKRLNTPEMQEAATAAAQRIGLPDGSGAILINLASVILTETSLIFFTPYLDNPTFLINAIAEGLQATITSYVLSAPR